MSFRVGTVECRCSNVMGMPTDVGECTVEGCEAKKSVWGENTYRRLVDWATDHSRTHEEVPVEQGSP